MVDLCLDVVALRLDAGLTLSFCRSGLLAGGGAVSHGLRSLIGGSDLGLKSGVEVIGRHGGSGVLSREAGGDARKVQLAQLGGGLGGFALRAQQLHFQAAALAGQVRQRAAAGLGHLLGSAVHGLGGRLGGSAQAHGGRHQGREGRRELQERGVLLLAGLGAEVLRLDERAEGLARGGHGQAERLHGRAHLVGGAGGLLGVGVEVLVVGRGALAQGLHAACGLDEARERVVTQPRQHREDLAQADECSLAGVDGLHGLRQLVDGGVTGERGKLLARPAREVDGVNGGAQVAGQGVGQLLEAGLGVSGQALAGPLAQRLAVEQHGAGALALAVVVAGKVGTDLVAALATKALAEVVQERGAAARDGLEPVADALAVVFLDGVAVAPGKAIAAIADVLAGRAIAHVSGAGVVSASATEHLVDGASDNVADQAADGAAQEGAGAAQKAGTVAAIGKRLDRAEVAEAGA